MSTRYDAAMPSKTYDKADYEGFMKSNIPAALAGSPGLHFDSAEDASLFFARELDFIKSQSYDVIYPEFTALALFPVSHEVNPGAETITYYSYDKTGLAKIISNYATDLPRADVKGKPTTVPVKSLGVSFGYSVQEMRASRLAGKSLDVRRAEAARYQNDYLANKIAWAGDEETGLVGVLSVGNDVPLYVIPANGKDEEGKPSTEWRHKTWEQILQDVNGMQAHISRTTKNVERPDTLALPADAYIEISTRKIEGTNTTVKNFILESAPYIKDIVPASELQSDSPETNPYARGENPQSVAFMFKKDEKKFSIEIPMDFYQYPLQPDNLEVVVPCESRNAGAVIYYPLSMLIAVGI